MWIGLHNHSGYSHDSISKIKDIVSFVKKDGGNAVALTDHGNMSGCVEFYKECKKQGIKPIIGNEIYICGHGKSAQDKSSDNKTLNHLVVLAKNHTGYKNLLKLHKISNKNFYYRPRIDEDELFAHKEGLIVLNGHHTTSLFWTLFFNLDAIDSCDTVDCCRQYLYPDYEKRFLEVATRYRDVFGDDFYVECQLFDKKDILQQASGTILFELAQKYEFKSTGTGDAHYITKDDAVFHKTFCAIKQNSKVRDLPQIGYFQNGSYGIVTQELANECYPKELILATQEIADKVENYNITLPVAIPSSNINNPRGYIRAKCEKKLKELNLFNDTYLSRLDYELEIIELGKLYDYFIIVGDYMQWAMDKGILRGPARGSAGGALISYLLNIITINPIKYNLLFDRFYSRDRAENKILPDIDCDFPASRRDDVISYIRNKYGHDKVAGVVTFSTLQGRNALKDVLRVYSACDFQSMNKITELIPARDKISDDMAVFKEDTGSDSVIYYCLKELPDLLKDYCTISENGEFVGDYAEYFKIAIGLEGAIKSESKHASAIIISSNSIDEVAPMIRDKSSDEFLVALDMDSFEDVSLAKFDVLGIKSLDCLTEVNQLLKEVGYDKRYK
jgi:DNA polymerase-3 subunit alpha